MSIRLVDSGWAQEFSDAVRNHGDELRIVCPFIKKRTIEPLLIRRPKRLQVITRFNLNECADGVNDIGAMQQLLNSGATIRGIKNLHAKLYLFGKGRAIVTSANLTHAALNSNHEFGIVSDDVSFNAACHKYFDDLWVKGDLEATNELLVEWDRRIKQLLAARTGAVDTSVGLPDYGTEIGIMAAMPTALPPAVSDARQAFVKFFGESSNRVPHSFPVLEEIIRARCDVRLSYPTLKTPRQVEDGALMFIGRLTSNPPDTRIFGRAFALKHVTERDEATEQEMETQNWRRKWSKYVRVYDAEFVAGTMSNGVSLEALMTELKEHSFASTKRNIDEEGENTDPKRAYLQQASVELSEEGMTWLNTRLQAALDKHGRVPKADLNRIAAMSLVVGTVTDLGRPYADGTRNLEIHTPVSRANGLPFEKERRKEIQLSVSGVIYGAGIRATERNPYVWISPDLIGPNAAKTNLGRVLTDAGFAANDRVLLEVDGDLINVVPVR